LLVVSSSTVVVSPIGCLSDVVVVVASVVPAVASCSGLSVDAELARDNRTITFYTLANTINALFTEFSGTYRFEL
jgi:hypothetical protein